MMSLNFRYNFIFGWLLLLIVTTPKISFSQSDPEMHLFNGGFFDMTFAVRSSMISGPGVNGALYGMTAPNQTGPFNIFGNPAVLGAVKGDQIEITMSPELELDIETLTDLDATLKEQQDETLNSFKLVTDPVYTDGSGKMIRDGTGLGGIAASFSFADSDTKWFGRFPKLLDRIAIGYYQPFYMNMAAEWSGLRLRIRTQSENEESEITMYTSIKMTTNFLITADSWAIAGAKQMGKFWFGATLSRTDIGINVSGHQKTEGILSLSQNESAFNSPGDPWDNEYFNSAVVQISGSSVGYRLGVTHQPSPKFLIGADLHLQTKALMEGPVEFQVHTFKPLNLTAGDDEEQFDVSHIKPDRLTETVSKDFDPGPITVELPSSFSIGFAYFGKFSPNITFKKYFGELSYSLQMYEDGGDFNYRRGFKLDWNALIGLKLGAVNISIGAIKMSDINEGYKDKNGQEIPELDPFIIPRLSAGYDRIIAENVTLSILGFGLPEDSIRLSLKFEF